MPVQLRCTDRTKQCLVQLISVQFISFAVYASLVLSFVLVHLYDDLLYAPRHWPRQLWGTGARAPSTSS